ncbi:sugar phosphate isomerase/epimerase family protein [Niabella soli]|uniref:Xylose isomerase n=1 Tax=Niabella soli DSM 19437 TaxID=929713 RepID=W0EZC3_9BACT|nr:sugar phosphate isomerase/epimerase [Niabella soli]AHF16112.1 xylose isomerase [Niabella soli DSM 19437]
MEIKFLCPRWGSEQVAWTLFLKEVKDAGYAGIEWFPFGEPFDAEDVLGLLEKFDLDFSIVMQVAQPYRNVNSYLKDLEKDLRRLATISSAGKRPLFISVQGGREFFTNEQIVACLDVCEKVAQETGIKICQETHRNKWSYAAHTVYPLLLQTPELALTLDVSHWFCVSESYLEDQQEAVQAAIKQTFHLHARVGHTEGPQVFDPALPEYAAALTAHLKIWDEWVDYCRGQGRKQITITPEFGPPPYMVPANRTTDLREEQWRLNLWMKNFLNERYNKTKAGYEA